MNNLFMKFDVDSVARDEDILPYLKDDAWFQQAAIERALGELTELREKIDRFDEKRLEIIQEFTSIIGLQLKTMARPEKYKARGMIELRNVACMLKQRLSETYSSFLRDSYRRYLPSETGGDVQDALIQELRINLVNRFESIVKPDVEKCLNLIDTFIIRCNVAEK